MFKFLSDGPNITWQWDLSSNPEKHSRLTGSYNLRILQLTTAKWFTLWIFMSAVLSPFWRENSSKEKWRLHRESELLCQWDPLATENWTMARKVCCGHRTMKCECLIQKLRKKKCLNLITQWVTWRSLSWLRLFRYWMFILCIGRLMRKLCVFILSKIFTFEWEKSRFESLTRLVILSTNYSSVASRNKTPTRRLIRRR